MKAGHRLTGRLAAGVAFGLLLSAIPLSHPQMALADTCPSYMEYHYSAQWTALSAYANFYHPPSLVLNEAYYGWVGIDGQILMPTHYPNLFVQGGGGSCHHSNGALAIHYDDTPGPLGQSFLTEGWYAGCQGVQSYGYYTCNSSSSGLSAFEEVYIAAGDTYFQIDKGTVGYSAAIIYRIEYSSSNHRWVLYTNYNVYVDEFCSTLPISGAPEAASEVHTHYSGNIVEMPVTVYGYSSPSTNNALRIKGAAGYVPWTLTLSSQSTSEFDERTTSLPYWYSDLSPNNYYWFKSYGQNTG